MNLKITKIFITLLMVVNYGLIASNAPATVTPMLTAQQNNKNQAIVTPSSLSLTLYPNQTVVTFILKSINANAVMLVPHTFLANSFTSTNSRSSNAVSSTLSSFNYDSPINQKNVIKLFLNFSQNNYNGLCTYLCSGLKWIPSYNLTLGKNNKATLQALVTVYNDTYYDFDSALLQFINVDPTNIEINPLILTMDRPHNLPAQSVTTICWLNNEQIKIDHDYRINIGEPKLLMPMHGHEIEMPTHMVLHLNAGDLKKPIMAGDVNIFVTNETKFAVDTENKDTNPLNGRKFVGKTTIADTTDTKSIPIELSLALNAQLKMLGELTLSNIKGQLEQTEFKVLTDKVTEIAYRLKLKNLSNNDITIKAVLPFKCFNCKVIRESQSHCKESANDIYWPITIPKHSESVLRYRIQLIRD